jgi:DNA polymerase-3 subunit gamma/tau
LEGSALAYISLYRKWRPQVFEEVIGQEYVTRTLQNSLRSGNYAHAFLFAGPRGTGKTSTARILAKALNCEEGPTPDPCNRCDSCRAIIEGTSVDVIEIDAASNNRIDDIRDLRERVLFSPAAARMKVYILDEAHMITLQAFNALLKMLEEPPSHVVFVLATTEPHKMPPTILSRCQRLDFRSVPVARLVEHLMHVSEEEGAEASEEALRLIARRARGSVRDALVVLEQAISYGDGKVEKDEVAGFLGLIEDETLARMGDYLADGDTAGAVSLVDKAYEEGRDLVQFAREVQGHFRKIFLLQYAKLGAEDLEVDESAYDSMRRQAEMLPPSRTFHFVNNLREAIREMQASSSPRLVLEVALMGMARSELDISPEALSARLARLEDEMDRRSRRERLEESTAGGSLEVEVKEKEKPPPMIKSDAGKEAEGEPADEALSAGGGGKEEEEKAGAASKVSTEPRDTVPIDLAAVRRAWPQIREMVKEKRVTTHAFLLEGKPQEVVDGELVILFPSDRSFHRGELEKKDHRLVLEEALEEVLGVGLKVRADLEEAGGREERPQEQEAGREAPAVEHQVEDGLPQAVDDQKDEEEKDGLEQEEIEEAMPQSGAGQAEMHDAGKVKLVKDVFGAEVVEEIKLGEES